MSACPDKVELYEYLDGELSRHRRSEIDLHVRGCAACRDELRESSAVQGHLFRRPVPEPEDDFEERFLVGLMDRMVTREETEQFRSKQTRRTWVAAAAAAVVVGCSLTMFFHRSRPVGTPGDELAAEDPAVRLEHRRASARAEVEAVVDGLSNGLVEVDQDDLSELDARLASTGLRLPTELLRQVEENDGGRFSGALAAMRIHGLPSYVTSLAAFLRRDAGHPRRSERRDLVLDVVGGLGTAESARLIGREVRRGLSADEGIRRLVLMDSEPAWVEVENLVSELPERDLNAVTGAIAAVDDRRATELLFDLYLDGRQVGGLSTKLAGREGVAERAREVVWGHPGNIDVTRRAIRLLGILRDESSVERLEPFLSRHEYAESTVVALADIGDDTAKRKLASRLELDIDVRLSSARQSLQYRLTGSIARFGPEGARFYLDEADLGRDSFDRHYVVAAGHCGTETILPSLKRFLDKDHLRAAATRAMGLIGHETTLPTLERLLRDRNAGVRREALRALKRIGHRPRARKGGFVRAAHPLEWRRGPEAFTLPPIFLNEN